MQPHRHGDLRQRHQVDDPEGDSPADGRAGDTVPGDEQQVETDVHDDPQQAISKAPATSAAGDQDHTHLTAAHHQQHGAGKDHHHHVAGSVRMAEHGEDFRSVDDGEQV